MKHIIVFLLSLAAGVAAVSIFLYGDTWGATEEKSTDTINQIKKVKPKNTSAYHIEPVLKRNMLT